MSNDTTKKKQTTQPASICLKNPSLYEPKQRQSVQHREKRVFEIKDLDLNDGIIQAEAMVRKEQLKQAQSKKHSLIPRSAKQVQLVKRAVSKSPDTATPEGMQQVLPIAPKQIL